MEVNELEFLPDLSQLKTMLPEELPRPVLRDKVPLELLRSTTIENLISQNEDLMARLKVTLRRLAILETENQNLAQENQNERASAGAALDQLLVHKEKDLLWKAKIDDLESAKGLLQEKLVNIEKLYGITQSHLERHNKYHERIKTHVKPFVQELKKYSKLLEDKSANLQDQLQKKEAQISDLRHQIVEITRNSKYQIEVLEKTNWEMTERYEDQIEKLKVESRQLKEIHQNLNERVGRLQSAQERVDGLENENIQLRRQMDSLADRQSFELEALQNKFHNQSSELARHRIEGEDAKARLLEELELRKNLERQVFDLRHQLDSLRFMWTNKNEENGKLRQTLQALENLNVDLSAKLQEIRSPGAPVEAPLEVTSPPVTSAPSDGVGIVTTELGSMKL